MSTVFISCEFHLLNDGRQKHNFNSNFVLFTFAQNYWKSMNNIISVTILPNIFSQVEKIK